MWEENIEEEPREEVWAGTGEVYPTSGGEDIPALWLAPVLFGLMLALVGSLLGSEFSSGRYMQDARPAAFLGVWVLAMLLMGAKTAQDLLKVVRGRALMSERGLILVGWTGERQQIAWADLKRLAQRETGFPEMVGGPTFSQIYAEARSEDGRPRRVDIATYRGYLPPEIEKLRDEIITRCGLQEVPPPWRSRLRQVVEMGSERVRVWRQKGERGTSNVGTGADEQRRRGR